MSDAMEQNMEHQKGMSWDGAGKPGAAASVALR